MPKPISFFNSSDAGIEISFNDKHLLKAKSPIFVTDEGIETLFNDEQLEKANFPISFNDEGIEISFNDKHPLKV